MKRFAVILLLLSLSAALPLRAQFYSTGAMPDSVSWRQIEGLGLRMLFPEYYEGQARRTMFYMDSMRGGIDWGLHGGVMRTPVVMKTLNFASNGLSMWAPKRIEIVGIPPADTYSTPWLKQLSVHEYRHTAQYTSLDRKTIRVLSYLFGQQIKLLTTGLMPFWWIEGDATDAETQASAYGRGLQPSFTMHYRAVGDDMLKKRNVDRWFGGSYREYIPSHYELGYQMVGYANTRRGEYAWREVVDYGARFPFLVFTTEIAERKYLNTSTRQLFCDTFTDLNDYWRTLPETEESARIIPTPETSYTVYSYPMFTSDTTIVALKRDFDRSQRFVEVDLPSGRERLLYYTGNVNSRPTIQNGTLYWTEYSQNSFWPQQINSLLYTFDLRSGRTTAHRSESRALFPIEGGMVRYDYAGFYEILCDGRSYAVDEGVSVHGLARDGETLYYIALSDAGMSIESIDMRKGLRTTIKKAAHVTISDLRAHDGRLYFGTIVSGRDEAAVIDLAEGREWLLSRSRYGAFQPSPSPDGERVVMTVYDRNGYHLAVSDAKPLEEVFYTSLPRNTVNPPRLKWELPNVDSIRYTTSDAEVSRTKYPSKRYSKAGHLLDFHSWAPLYYNPEQIMAGNVTNLLFGATLVSQNLLSSAVASVGYGYSLSGAHLVDVNFKYTGLPVKLEFDALWNSSNKGYYQLFQESEGRFGYWRIDDGDYRVSIKTTGQPAPTRINNMPTLYARAYLPYVIEHSYHTRILVPSVDVSYSNVPIFNPDNYTYSRGYSIGAVALQYSNNVSKAKRDILPPWGYTVRLAAGRMFARTDVTTTLGISGLVYMRGFALHHAITLRAGYSDAVGTGPLAYSVNVNGFAPRGTTEHSLPVGNLYASAEYQLPLCYPDWGLQGVVFIKRIRMSLFADGSFYAIPGGKSAFDGKIYSGGGSFYFDCSFLRLPEAADTALRLSVYVPRFNQKPVIGGGIEVDF